MRRIVLAAIAAAAVAGPLGLGSANASVPLCIPSYTGYGPSVYIHPDLQHPARSDVGYDSSDFGISFDLCVI